MGLFDSISRKAGSAIGNAAANAVTGAVNEAARKRETFTFTTIPRSMSSRVSPSMAIPPTVTSRSYPLPACRRA